VVKGLPYGRTRFSAEPTTPTRVFPGRSPWLTVDENSREALLRIPTKGKSMRVRAAGAKATQGALLLAELGGEDAPDREFSFREDGTALLEPVAPGTYSILVLATTPGADGRAGRLDRFEFTGAEIVVPMGPPRSVRVRPRLAEGATDVAGILHIRSTKILEMASAEGGTLSYDGLPEGEYAVSVWAKIGEQTMAGHGSVKTGETLDLEMTSRESDR
jgi:hypothetical protein